MLEAYELKLEKFSGPIEKLLSLIEAKKLEITELNLADVTADFLEYLKKVEIIEPRFLADFVVVASRLLLIKSKALLPELKLTKEEEVEIKDLENRIIFYSNFKPAMANIKNFLEKEGISFSRQLFAGRASFFYPSENISINSLNESIKKTLDFFERMSIETETIKPLSITLEDKIKEIISRVETAMEFNELTGEKPREEIIVLFLALLHLLNNQIVKAEQKEGFSDIIITRTKSADSNERQE